MLSLSLAQDWFCFLPSPPDAPGLLALLLLRACPLIHAVHNAVGNALHSKEFKSNAYNARGQTHERQKILLLILSDLFCLL